MPRVRHSVLLLSATLALTSCQLFPSAPPPAAPVPAPVSTEPPAVQPAPLTTVFGTVQLPEDWINQRAVLALTNVAVAGLTVTLVDTAGRPVSGLAPTQTDAHGAYAFSHVPSNATYRVQVTLQQASGPAVTFLTFVKTGATTTRADITLATTLAAQAALSAAASSSNLDAVDAEAFGKAVEGVAAMLTHATLPPAPRLDGLAQVVKDWIAGHAELAQQITKVFTPPPSGASGPAPSPSPFPSPPGGGASVPWRGELELDSTAYTGIAAPLAVRVRTTQGPRPQTLTVTVRSALEPSGETLTLSPDASGVYSGSLPFQRRYDEAGVAAAIAADGRIAVYAEGGVASDTVTVALGDASQSVTFEEPSSTVTGIVRVNQLPRAFVQVQLVGSGVSRKTASRADGSYAFHDVPSGTYSVTFAVDGGVPTTRTVSVP